MCSLDRRGLGGTVAHIFDVLEVHVVGFISFISLDRFIERRFDRNCDVDTADQDDLAELKSHPQYPHAVPYDSTPPSIFRRMLRGLNIDHSEYVFVDMGCGKGKVVLLAAELPFKRVVGVELSPKLARIAENNLRAYRGPRKCRCVEVHCLDAAEYRIPQEPTVLFFFNPFKEPVMKVILESLRRSLEEQPRQLFILYNVPMLRSLMDNASFLIPVRHTMWFSIYKTMSS